MSTCFDHGLVAQDEAYISNEGLHFMSDETMDHYDRDRIRIAILDNFVFIVEYYAHSLRPQPLSGDETDETLFHFVDGSLKYIRRIGQLIRASLKKGGYVSPS